MCVCVCVSEKALCRLLARSAVRILADGGRWQGRASRNPPECPNTDWQQAEQHAATGILFGTHTHTHTWHSGLADRSALNTLLGQLENTQTDCRVTRSCSDIGHFKPRCDFFGPAAVKSRAWEPPGRDTEQEWRSKEMENNLLMLSRISCLLIVGLLVSEWQWNTDGLQKLSF